MVRVEQYLRAGFLLVVLVSLLGCKKTPSVDQVTFQVLYNGQPVDCHSNLPLAHNNWRIRALLFYVSDFAYQGHRGGFDYQQEPLSRVALIGSRCEDGGRWSIPIEWQAVDSLQAGEPTDTLRFTLGVPFELNHSNPLQAKAPLADSDMFWTWQLGYKFFRLDASQTENTQHWALHFGSLGCNAASAMRAPTEACLHPNQIPVAIEDFQAEQPIYLHLDKILSDAVVGQENCMGDPKSSACQPVFAALSQTQSELAVFNQVK